MNIRQVEAELFHADGRTDMMKLIMVFHNFANAPKTNLITGKIKRNVIKVKYKGILQENCIPLNSES
jgi:hypothetical protein